MVIRPVSKFAAMSRKQLGIFDRQQERIRFDVFIMGDKTKLFPDFLSERFSRIVGSVSIRSNRPSGRFVGKTILMLLQE